MCFVSPPICLKKGKEPRAENQNDQNGLGGAKSREPTKDKKKMGPVEGTIIPPLGRLNNYHDNPHRGT